MAANGKQPLAESMRAVVSGQWLGGRAESSVYAGPRAEIHTSSQGLRRTTPRLAKSLTFRVTRVAHT